MQIYAPENANDSGSQAWFVKFKRQQREPTVTSFVHSRMSHYMHERREEIWARDENYAENGALDEKYTGLRITPFRMEISISEGDNRPALIIHKS